MSYNRELSIIIIIYHFHPHLISLHQLSSVIIQCDMKPIENALDHDHQHHDLPTVTNLQSEHACDRAGDEPLSKKPRQLSPARVSNYHDCTRVTTDTLQSVSPGRPVLEADLHNPTPVGSQRPGLPILSDDGAGHRSTALAGAYSAFQLLA